MTTNKTFVAAVVMASAAACAGLDARIPDGAEEKALEPVISQESSSFSGYDQQTRLVIRDQEAWNAAWATLTAGSSGGNQPQIDFRTEMVVLAAMGQRPSGGYWIEITRAAATPEAFYVAVTEHSYGARCANATVMTAPVTVVRGPRFDGAVQFIESQQTHDCQ